MGRLRRLRLGSAFLAQALAAALSATFAAGARAQDDTVTVGFPVALSGFVAPYDDGPRKAALLAIDDINKEITKLAKQQAKKSGR